MDMRSAAKVYKSWDDIRRREGDNYQEIMGKVLDSRIAATSPKLKKRFEKTPHHSKMLIAQLDVLVDCLGPDESIFNDMVRNIGVRHAQYGVTSKYYLVLAESIMSTLSHFLGQERWSQVQLSWNDLIQNLFRAMKKEAKRELQKQEKLLHLSKTKFETRSSDEDSGHTDSSSWVSTSENTITMGTVPFNDGKSVSMRSIFSLPGKTPCLSQVEEEIPLSSRSLHRTSLMRSNSTHVRRDYAVASDTPPRRCKRTAKTSTVSSESVPDVPISHSKFASPRCNFFHRKTPTRPQSRNEVRGGLCAKGALERISAFQLAVLPLRTGPRNCPRESR